MERSLESYDREIQELHDSIIQSKFSAARSVVVLPAILTITLIGVLANWWWPAFISWLITIYVFADLLFFAPKKRKHYKVRLDKIKEQQQ